MKERGIIFSAPMVLALLAGRKTVTRRMSRQWLKLQVGQRLWVRETWAHYQTVNHVTHADGRAFSAVSDGRAGYRADGFDTVQDFREHVRLMCECDLEAVEVRGNRWTPAIHMPRWASRITLEVSEPPRLERAQDITAYEVIAEGVEPAPHRCGCDVCARTSQLCTATQGSLVLEFSELWRQLHKKPGERWEDDPEVVRIAFKRLTETA